ncbi:MAG: hypothetical protein H0T64_10380 [Pyrinomonadaceae bacterium]|nr:hypothetical protein [Pyrinomonadaceae bacterium]
MKIWITPFFILGFTFGAASFVAAQEDPKLNPAKEQQQKEKAEKEKAFTLCSNRLLVRPNC